MSPLYFSLVSQGQTMMFTKSGYLLRKFPSYLPGGYRHGDQGV